MSIFPTRILVATDGSEEAALALTTAADLSKSTNSELHVAYVFPTAVQRPKLIVPQPRISQILLAAVSKHCEDGVCNSKMAILDDILGGT